MFGPADVVRREDGVGWRICRASWRSEGLTIYFYNLGLGNPCTPQFGYFGSAVITGKHWRTGKGLRIGDTAYKMNALYRPTRWTGQWSWLVWGVERIDCALPRGCPTPKLQAKTMNGRVVAFRVYYSAGGV